MDLKSMSTSLSLQILYDMAHPDENIKFVIQRCNFTRRTLHGDINGSDSYLTGTVCLFCLDWVKL